MTTICTHPLNGVQRYRLDRLIDKVCERFEIAREDLLGEGRTWDAAEARHCVAMHARNMFDLTYKQIAHALGRQHHSIPARGIDVLEARMRTNAELKNKVMSMRLYAAGLAEIDRLPEPVRPV
jgi:chromosomal replication initiation ATPase DnaA